jgi:DNA-binding GntR family transcriptional regulator
MSESSSTKAEDLALVLEEAIVSGELAPGSVLRQEELSARYRVSRTPVREALRRLAALGLVSFAPNRSVRVRTLSREELREAFLVRAELESLATGLAVPNMTDDDFVALDAAERRFSELTDALLDRDESERARLTAEWVAANQAFHDVIYAAARAPLVEQIAKSARRTFLGQAVWRAGGHEIDDLYRKNVVQHRAICDALYSRSVEGAKALAREHVMSSCKLLEVILDEMSRRPPTAA